MQLLPKTVSAISSQPALWASKSVNFRGCILYNVSLFQWKIVDASKNCGAWTALQVQGVWFQFFYFAFINAYPLKDSLVDRGKNVSRFPPLYFEYLGNVRENNNSRKSGRNNTRLLPVLQTVIHCKDGLRAKIIRKDFKTYFLNPSLNDSKKQSQIAIKITI